MIPREEKIWSIFYLLIISVNTVMEVYSVRLMPLGDILVLKFSSVAFSVILSPLFLEVNQIFISILCILIEEISLNFQFGS